MTWAVTLSYGFIEVVEVLRETEKCIFHKPLYRSRNDETRCGKNNVVARFASEKDAEEVAQKLRDGLKKMVEAKRRATEQWTAERAAILEAAPTLPTGEQP